MTEAALPSPLPPGASPAELIDYDLDVAVSTAQAGRGGRPLMLVHGFTGAKEDFADHLAPLAERGWWAVAPDLRGHGGSGQPEGEDAYGISTFALDVLGLADALGWGTFTLLGHSMGGMVAQQIVLDHPQRLDRLVLMDTHHAGVEGMDEATVAIAVDVLRTQGLDALLDLIDRLPRSERAPSDQRLRETREGFGEWADGKVRRCSAAMYAAMARELTGRADRLSELASVQVPTRIVVGAEDRGFLAAAGRMDEAMSTADLVVIPDAAHSPQFENPSGWWEAVVPFIEGAPG